MTETATTLRAELKAAGYTARQVTVRQGACTLYVTIRDPRVSRGPVAALAQRHVCVRRCDVSGEILLGGNTFVSVRYSDAAAAVLTGLWRDAVEQAVRVLSQGPTSHLQPVEGTPYFIGRQQYSPWLSVWGESTLMATPGDVEDVACWIGQEMIA